jgi:hypothetical protein
MLSFVEKERELGSLKHGSERWSCGQERRRRERESLRNQREERRGPGSAADLRW